MEKEITTSRLTLKERIAQAEKLAERRVTRPPLRTTDSVRGVDRTYRNNLQQARAKARGRVLARATRQASTDGMSIVDPSDQLADHLGYLLYDQLNSPTPIGRFSMGTFSHEAVDPVIEGWLSGGEGFIVTRSPFRMESSRRRATRNVTFSYADGNGDELFSLDVRERFSRNAYDDLRDRLYREEGLPRNNGSD